MNLYHCMIELKSDARALAFAMALESWMELLHGAGRIGAWRLLRRKLNLAGPGCADFLLEIEVADLAQLDAAFRFLGRGEDEATRRYDQMRQHVASVEYGLYRPFPDPERAEQLALI
ncbi:MAG TPA: hypothetical protein GX700_01220 [Paracoccus sp.]|nr:hypothetical protein [Paracoccus sp. (in: a-proteobacteria)]